MRWNKYAEVDILSVLATLTLSMFKLYGISEEDLITNDDHEKTGLRELLEL